MKKISIPHPPKVKNRFCCKVCGSPNMKTNSGLILADDHDCLDCGAWQCDTGFWHERKDGKINRLYFQGDGEYFGLNM